MKSLQDYIDIYRGIANKLNITGDSVEILSQMLANASFFSYCINIIKWFIDAIYSPSTRQFIVKRSIPIEKVVRGEYKIKVGSACVFKNGKTYNGHIGMVYYWDKSSGQLIEGNAGNKIQLMSRSYQPRNFQRITHFTEFTYRDNRLEQRVLDYKQHPAKNSEKNNVSTY
jgi:hypothetical protein